VATSRLVLDRRNNFVRGAHGGASRDGLEFANGMGVAARSVLYMDKDGLKVSGRTTDAEMTLTAWNPERNGSGWAGQATRDWSKLKPTDIAAQCLEMTRRAANPV